MNPSLNLALLLGVAGTAAALIAPPGATEQSTVSRVLRAHTPTPAKGQGPVARVAAVSALLGAIDDDLRADLLFPIDDGERALWSNLPPRNDSGGLRLGDLDEAGVRAACNLLATVLSPEGYARIRDIMLGDDQLLRGGRPREGFGAENMWLLVFGEPSAEGPWGLQLDGHHLALNLSFKGEAMTLSPTFLGAQPARYERDKDQVAPMADLSAAAHALAASLTEEQRSVAIVNHQRGANVAAAGKDGHVPKATGLPCDSLSTDQASLLVAVLGTVTGTLPAHAADMRLKELTEEIPHMHFAWSGPTEAESDMSFRIQGPTLILEWACQDLGGDPLQHIHAMVRNPVNEYGAGL